MDKNNMYDPKKIEDKWIKIWDEKKVNHVPLSHDLDKSKEKFHVLDMFPYPSGEGLHAGHAKIFSASDAYARFKRLQGYNVLHVQGYDAFGLPAEQYAIKNKVNPKVSTKKNTDNFGRQMRMLGLSYDWDREVNTTDPEFYKWTQWIFKQLYKTGLVYESYDPINWCPSCKTGLANEDLENGLCERCGSVVEKKPIRQWSIKITEYAEKLLRGVDGLDWKESIKEMQRNWIGESEGSEIDFDSNLGKISVFTTRADTLFGATYMVLAPEHPLVTLAIGEKSNLLSNKQEVSDYVENAKQKSEIERSAEGKEKTGVKLEGVFATNPANSEKIPVYVADYVLGGYGTGAIMAVPAHDERDREFAEKFGIPVKEVIQPYYVQSSEPGKYRENEPTDVRNSIIAIVKHSKDDKYMALKWKQVAWGTFVTGGIENGQTGEEAARMEIKEETGFHNLKFVKSFGIVNGLFYHVPKKTNRLAKAEVLYFELLNEDRINVSEVESEIHEVKWLTVAELEKFLTPDTHRYSLNRLVGKIKSFTEYGMLFNSGNFDGLTSEEARVKITESVGGKLVKKYKLRDWVFARQRYWGEPFPIVFDSDHKSYLVSDKCLPVTLPDVESYEPTGNGESPLANIKDFVKVRGFINQEGEFEEKEDGEVFYRETNTMPQWAGSSWYWLRYLDPKNSERFVGVDEEKYWSSNGYSVDMYLGGLEHATRHLIYARFWNLFLYDQGILTHKEPFKRLEAVGLILGEDGQKMSKRTGNVVNPDDVVHQFGADTLRLYIAFAGDYHDSFSWDSKAIVGPRRFIERVWGMQYKLTEEKPEDELESLMQQTVQKVTSDYELLKFNTAVAQMMIYTNAVEKIGKISTEHYKKLLVLISPLCPFFTEEIWTSLGYGESVHKAEWPKVDETKLLQKNVKIAVQIGGKLRDVFECARDLSDEEVLVLARNTEGYKKWVGEAKPKKEIVVKNKIVNIVV